MTRRRFAVAVVVFAVFAAAAGVWFAGRDDDNGETFEPVSEYRFDDIHVDTALYGFDIGFMSTPSWLEIAGAAAFAVFALWLWRRDRRGDARPPT